MLVTSEKITLAICLLMNSFSQLSFNKNICDTLYLNLFKLSYSYIFWLQWFVIFINYISLKIFRLSIISYVKKIINVTRNIFNANKVHCHFKNSCLRYWLLPTQNSMQFTPIFLEKLCHCLCIILEWTYSVVDLDTSRMIVTLT